MKYSGYNEKFTGMTDIEVSPEDLKEASLILIHTIHSSLSKEHKQFLLSMAEGSPDWRLVNIPNTENFPGILWKLENIKNLMAKNPIKHKQMMGYLKEVLAID